VSSSPADAGAARAEALLGRLADGDRPGAEGLLAGLDVRDLTFTGAALTTLARAERHTLLPGQRAQANTRQMLLGQRRDGARSDPGALRDWLLAAGDEVLFLRSLERV